MDSPLVANLLLPLMVNIHFIFTSDFPSLITMCIFLVENFPGFPTGILGPELMEKFREQSIRFGTRIITETVSKIDLSSRPFRYWREMQEGDEPETADTIIIATGASAKRLGLKGEQTYWQSGISACAVCDGAVPIFRNKPLAVIGGGDSAAEEATCALGFFVVSSSNMLRIDRFDQVWVTCVCPSPTCRAPCLENYGEQGIEKSKDSEFSTSRQLESSLMQILLDCALEHRSCRVSR